jgi:hypothetical protein
MRTTTPMRNILLLAILLVCTSPIPGQEAQPGRPGRHRSKSSRVGRAVVPVIRPEGSRISAPLLFWLRHQVLPRVGVTLPGPRPGHSGS